MMRHLQLLVLALVVLCGCYIPPRPLPQWEVDRMRSHRSSVPCSAFHRGQRLGSGSRVVKVYRSYVVVRTRSGDSQVIPCRVR